MPQSDSMSDAFKAGPADLTKPEHVLEWERFFRQAYWLGECANIVYPPSSAESGRGCRQQKREKLAKLLGDWDDAPWADFFRKVSPDEAEADNSATDAELQALETASSTFSGEWLDRESRLEEHDIDALADELHRLYHKEILGKYLFPWRWLSETREQQITQARQKWLVAHELWVQKARTRIERWIKAVWHADERDDVPRVTFESTNGTEYFIAGDRNLVILCFRGTEGNKFGDILTDILAWQVEEPAVAVPVDLNTSVQIVVETGPEKQSHRTSRAKLHQGFWSALDGIWKDIEEKQFPRAGGGFRSVQAEHRQQVWITGHSLGGALAALAAYQLVTSGTLNADQIGGVFTFGQPRVGDQTFVQKYKEITDKTFAHLNDRHFRFVNNNDVVTKVPPKSFWLIGLVASTAIGAIRTALGSGRKAVDDKGQPGQPSRPADSEMDQKRTIEYGDVGRVVFANRTGELKLLTPDHSAGWVFWKLDFWWPVRLHFLRKWSRLKTLFMPYGFGSMIERLFPGIPDHSMTGYNRVLELECRHRAFVSEAVTKMNEAMAESGNDQGQADPLLKAAEKAWSALKTRADRAARTAQKRARKLNQPRDAAKQAGQNAWDTTENESRQSTIEKAVSDWRSVVGDLSKRAGR